jgi:hypothetical protein
MDVQEIIAELRNESERLNQAIAALEGVSSRQGTTKSRASTKPVTAKPVTARMHQASTGKKTRGGMTEEGRKRLSEAMKKRWAARRK